MLLGQRLIHKRECTLLITATGLELLVKDEIDKRQVLTLGILEEQEGLILAIITRASVGIILAE